MDSRAPNDPRSSNWKITDPVDEDERYLPRMPLGKPNPRDNQHQRDNVKYFELFTQYRNRQRSAENWNQVDENSGAV